MSLLLNWFVSAAAIFIAAYLLPQVTVESFWVAIVLAVVLGLLNAIVKPVMFILTLPINILTLGLFTFVINAATIMLADYFVNGFEVHGFWWAMLFSLVLGLINWILKAMAGTNKA